MSSDHLGTLPTGLLGSPDQGPVLLVAYDQTWANRFEHHREVIERELGELLLQIHHIGSTAVPGLSAKPIVDILAVVADSANESSYVPLLEAAGYRLRVREPNFEEHRMFQSLAKDVHLHVFSSGSAEIARYLVFRDRLRTSSTDRRRYERVKQELASRDWQDRNDYAAAKSEIVEGIIHAAMLP